MVNAQILNTILCDDARKEMSGKDILIGVYGGQIQFGALPATNNFVFWFEVLSKKKGICNLTFKIQSPNPNVKMEFKLQLEVGEPDISFGVFTPHVPISFDREGEFKISSRSSEKEKFQLLRTYQIKALASPTQSLATERDISPSSTS